VRHLSDEDWRNIVDVNLWGVIHGSRVAVRHMVPRGTGHIINVASMSGLFPVPMTTAYATTKHAVVGLSTCLRAELADLGVAVTVVCPGLTDTAIWQVSPIRSADRKRLLDALPFRYESAERVAAAILEGAARRRAMVVVPAHARLLWWLNRAAPGPTLEVLRLIVRRLRSVAATSGDAIFSAPRNGGET
jgi:short-subunit dehydrogenase